MNPPIQNNACSSSSCGCGSNLARRDFLKLSGLAATGLALSRLPAMAGPFTRADFDKLVPADKKLSDAWIKSLFERGTPATYSWPESQLIGMPIGGICCGQVYLGGDGRLWHWDIFNQHIGTGAEHYAKPMQPTSLLDQGFALLTSVGGQTQVRRLDHTGWNNVSFKGEYPLGFVEYRDAAAPVSVSLESFSPFIPLNVDDSSLPATVMRFTIKNTGAQKVEAELAGWLENAVCLHSGQSREVQRRNRIVRRGGFTALECSAEPPPEGTTTPQRADVLFDDFERDTYDSWTAEGTAFGKGPIAKSGVMDYQGDLGMHGQHAINSHAAAPGNEVGGRDAQTGTLTSKTFIIERNYINFLIGGGSHKGRTCVNLLVDGKTALSAIGPDNNKMRSQSWDVRKWLGKSARIQAVDNETGAWGNIGLDYIVFSDVARRNLGPLASEPDFGTMTLTLLNSSPDDSGAAALPDTNVPAGLFSKSPADTSATAARPFNQKLVGSVTRKLSLAPGESAEAVFVVTWHFANLKMDRLPPGRHYGTRFNSGLAVAEHLAQRYATLREQTHLWHDTWYDSTLPWWFLDRTFLNTSILATSTSFRFADGRFWGWEGVGCCHGTCGHVWQYAHAMARLFPELSTLR